MSRCWAWLKSCLREWVKRNVVCDEGELWKYCGKKKPGALTPGQ